MQVTTTTDKVAQVAVDAVTEAKKSTGKIGIGQIGNTTPNWSTWMFRIWFYLAQFTTIIIAMVSEIADAYKVKILFWLAIANIAVHGFSKMWGIDTKKIQQEAIDAFTQAQQP